MKTFLVFKEIFLFDMEVVTSWTPCCDHMTSCVTQLKIHSDWIHEYTFKKKRNKR